MLQQDVKAPAMTPSAFKNSREITAEGAVDSASVNLRTLDCLSIAFCAKSILVKIASSCFSYGGNYGSILAEKPLPGHYSIFERPEPTGMSSVAFDGRDTATSSWKRTMATTSNSTYVTDSQPK